MYDLGIARTFGRFHFFYAIICLNMQFSDVEKARLEYKKRVQNGIIIGATSAIIVIVGAFALNRSSSFSLILTALSIGMIVVVFTTVIITITTHKYAQAYRAAYKAYFVDTALRKTFTDIQYNHLAGLAESVLSSTGMVNTGDVYDSNDLATGKYKDVAFTQADVHIQEEHRDSDGDKTYVTIFKGRFMIFEFPKKFNFRLEVVEKWFGANTIPGKNKTTGRKFERIEVESTEFNHIFNAYAEDGFEAFYLLDPAFINNMLTLADQYKGKILLGFIDNKLIVGLKDGKDAFEPPSIFSAIDEQTEASKITSDIHLITNFVDTLKLNRKLFK